MARPLWSGSLSFGLVNVPVQLVSAARDLDFHFHQLHKKDKSRIEQRRYCVEEDVELAWEEVARSYRFDNGKEVVVTDEELGLGGAAQDADDRHRDLRGPGRRRPDLLRPPLLPRSRGRERGHAPGLPAAGGGHGERGAGGPGALRDADQGVPGGRPRSRRGAGPHHDALPRRGAAHEAGAHRRREAGEGRGRPGGGDHRGARHRVGPRALHRLLPGAPGQDHRAQAEGCDGGGPAGAAAAEAGARPDGGPPAHPRPGARGGRPPSRAGRRTRARTWPS